MKPVLLSDHCASKNYNLRRKYKNGVYFAASIVFWMSLNENPFCALIAAFEGRLA